MRPKKTRWIKCEPGERCFRPQGVFVKDLEEISLTVDEFETIRLADYEQWTQARIAVQMKIHRSTVSRILTSAHKKIADAFVNKKAVKVEGGCCKFKRR